jgi:hypothetical protein
MNLKNYTSTIPASTSISRIEKMLVDIGAKNINKQYDQGKLISLTFLIDVSGQTMIFKLPAKVDVIFKMFWDQVKRPQAGTKEKTYQQAERTAWKLLHDWIEIQCSMIKLEQAEFIEVFLPYAYNPELGTTFFEQLKQLDYKLLNAKTSS